MLESTHGQPPLQWPYAALVLGSVLAVRALLSMPKKGAFRNSAWLLSLLLPAYQAGNCPNCSPADLVDCIAALVDLPCCFMCTCCARSCISLRSTASICRYM